MFHAKLLQREFIYSLSLSIIPLFFAPLRVDDVRYPVDRFRNAMIDPWLAGLRARVTGRDDAYQVPSPRLLQHQWPAAVALREQRKRYRLDPTPPQSFNLLGTSPSLLRGNQRTSSRRKSPR